MGRVGEQMETPNVPSEVLIGKHEIAPAARERIAARRVNAIRVDLDVAGVAELDTRERLEHLQPDAPRTPSHCFRIEIDDLHDFTREDSPNGRERFTRGSWPGARAGLRPDGRKNRASEDKRDEEWPPITQWFIACFTHCRATGWSPAYACQAERAHLSTPAIRSSGVSAPRSAATVIDPRDDGIPGAGG